MTQTADEYDALVDKIIRDRRLWIPSDEELRPTVEDAVRALPKAARDFQQGKVKALGAIVGRVLQHWKGARVEDIERVAREVLSDATRDHRDG